MTKKRKGFSIVEAVVYVGLSSIMILALSGFVNAAWQSKIKNKSVREVEFAGKQISDMIYEEISSAEGVNYPTSGTRGDSMSLSFSATEKNPEIFLVEDNILKIKKGGNDSLAIHSDNLTISEVEFENSSFADGADIINFSFKLSYKNSQKGEYNYERVFRTSAGIRR